MRNQRLEASIEHLSLDALSGEERALVLAARAATDLSYSPYSRFRVGCAARLKGGEVISGANFENASYGLSMCAERSVIFSVNNAGGRRDIVAMAITGRSADEALALVGRAPVSPCGACRQVIHEAETLAGATIVILLDGFDDGHVTRVVGIGGLLPLGFGPSDLGVKV